MTCRLTGLIGLTTLLLAGCAGAQGDVSTTPHPPMPRSPQPDADAGNIPVAASTSPVQAPVPGVRRAVRVIDKDPDADGIADHRIIVTEVFDANGLLLERIREEDFEADGIVDARAVTSFAD
jgi:hypothetical protein